MKKIYVEKDDATTVHISLIAEHGPIFAKKDGVLKGMIVNEEGKGWVTRLGGALGATGHSDSLRACIQEGQEVGYEYYT